MSAVRTPLGSFNGALAGLTGPQLGVAAVRGALAKVGVDGKDIDEAFFGNVVTAGEGQAPARQVVIGAGLPLSIPCTTVNKVCASGMKAVMFAAQSISLGHNDVVLAGGFESMTNVPYYMPKARFGYRMGNQQVIDGIVHDGLWDVYNNFHMGNCAEKCAKDYSFSREAQDAYAARSYERAAAAWAAGKFDEEVIPVEVPQRKGDPVVVKEDEEFRNIKLDRVSQLKPAFQKDGTVTAANASSINDGASALLIMSAERAQALGLTPLARIRGYGDAAHAPEDFTTAPAKAVPVALKRAGLSVQDIEYHEINEAFSVVALVNQQLLGADPDRVNVNGGAVSLGHPIGCSGARIITTLVNVLKQNDATLGAASICNGGGGASAIIVERV